MKLILMRHGHAVDREEFLGTNKDDSQRPLTEKGKERSEKMARFLAKQIQPNWVIATSPYLRAKQTAQAIKNELKVQSMKDLVELVPAAPPQALMDRLRSDFSQTSDLICVGHEPQLSSFLCWILSGSQHGFVEFKKSGMAYLEVESFSQIAPGRAELRWLLHPKLFE